MQDFRNEVAVITGAGSGLGRALALDLARAGAHVEVSDIDEPAAERTAADCRDLGAWAKGTALDVVDRGAALAHAEAVEAAHGKVDLVINNAGIALAGLVAEQRLDDVDHVLDVNLRGVINGTQAFLPALERSPAGRLVNISSIFGFVAMPFNSAYCASKFAVRAFTEVVAMEQVITGSTVTVICVHPGGVATDIIDNARTTPSAAPLVHRFRGALRKPPDHAARIILRGVARHRRRVLVGTDAWTLHLLQLAAGPRFQQLIAAGGRRLVANELPVSGQHRRS